MTVYGSYFAPLAQQTLTVSAGDRPDSLQVTAPWRDTITVLCRICDLSRLPNVRWAHGWVDNPPEWRSQISHGALQVYRQWAADHLRECDQ
ncbi:hypothetical protein LX16_3267 [Stackebrandtia albiflava]|uniref:Uncharacterized protein n=1 Tax=Stackebrandtia albiflava TaxID=406432 RepID=A0A562V3U8_9ACTN|nr:hypothetical protein [Stackebrandtia albiflava]TWJ12508.1 hypothetical protein LX16_3267 [Stackebrandtia albiflava]